MSKKKIYLTIFILTLGLTLLFAGPSAAMKFRGMAVVAQHYNGKNMLDDYSLMIKKQDVQQLDIQGVALKKLSVQKSALPGHFYKFDVEDTNEKVFGANGAEDYYFFKIDDFAGSKYEKKRNRLFAKVTKKVKKAKAKEDGLRYRDIKNDSKYNLTEWQVWSSDLGRQFFNKKKFFKMKIFDANGKKHTAKIAMNFFLNSSNSGPVNNPVSVPEPATMLMLGVGLLGLAGMRRRFKK